MEPIANEPNDPIVQEFTGLGLLHHRLRNWFARLRQHIPRLVWPGQEIDVRVTFSQDPLRSDSNPDVALAALHSGGLHEIQQQLRHMGIVFDSGQGYNGRDWEWDWSLSGPISVTFRDHAKNPERRNAAMPSERLKLKLVS